MGLARKHQINCNAIRACGFLGQPNYNALEAFGEFGIGNTNDK